MAVGMHKAQIREVVRATMVLGKHMMHMQILAVFEQLVTDGTAALLPAGELPRAIRQGLGSAPPRGRLTRYAAEGIPAGKFWSFTVYDNQTRSMGDPRSATASGSRAIRRRRISEHRRLDDVYFSQKADGVNAGNWIQTDPRKGWFTILRLYRPLEPFFTKEWRPSEIEVVR